MHKFGNQGRDTPPSIATSMITSSSSSMDSTDSEGVISVTSSGKEGLVKYSHHCGYGSFKPRWLQRCNNPKCLMAVICWFVFVQSFVVNGLVNVNTATMERRFDLTSSQVAWVSSSYDVIGGILSFIVGYLATFANKPRMMTISAAVMAVGSFVMVTPHLIVDPYTLGTARLGTCGANDTTCAAPPDSPAGAQPPSSLSKYVYILILGQLLHGFGGVGVYTIGTPLIDESVPSEHSPIYIGIMQMTSALGPALGFIVGGVMLNQYVDFDRVDMSEVTVTPDDPRWVGAWWVGFGVAAVAGLVVVLLMGCFPEELPDTARHRTTRVSEAYAGRGEQETENAEFGRSWPDFVTSLRIVLANPTFVIMTFGAIMEAGIIQAYVTFMPKILQFQFVLSPAKAALIGGAVVVPGAATGQVLGGLIPKWLRLKVRGLILQCALGAGVTLIFSFTFVFRCDMSNIAGVTSDYLNRSQTPTGLTHACNAECGCSLHSYEPVCGTNNVQYFSPCHAGCMDSYTTGEGVKVHANCSCLDSYMENEYLYGHGSFNESSNQPYATDGVCKQDCNALKYFLPVMFLMCMTTFIANTAFHTITMRVVPMKQRAFAYGLQGTMIRFLGATPFPVFFGIIFDNVCLVWQEKCSFEGSCWIYDNQNLGKKIMFFIITVKFLSTLSFFAAFFSYKPPRYKDEISTEEIKLSVSESDSDTTEQKFLNNVEDLEFKDRKSNRNLCIEEPPMLRHTFPSMDYIDDDVCLVNGVS